MKPRERWECCGQGTRLKVCMSCGAAAPWAHLLLREPLPAQPKPENACKACGLPLTDPVSIRRGYGPNCWEGRLSWAARGRPRAALVVATPAGCCDTD